MIYKFIYYKYYQWISEWLEPFAPQITSTLAMALLPLSILYPIIRLFIYLNIVHLSFSYSTNPIVVAYVIVFILLLAFNQIYFFVFNNWKEIILSFRKNEVSKKCKISAYVIIIYSTTVYLILFLFLGYNF